MQTAEIKTRAVKPQNIVKSVTISPLRGDSENSNNMLLNQEQAWQEAVGLITDGVNRLSSLMKQAEIPDIIQSQVIDLTDQLARLLKAD